MILCYQRNYKYVVFYNGNECVCLNDQEVLRFEKLLVVVCDVLCSVNDEECCGGNIVVLIFLVVVRFILFVDERVVGLNGECI